MDYFQKYLNVRKNIVKKRNWGGEINIADKKKFAHLNTYLNYPFTWMSNYNIYNRPSLLLMLNKLSRNNVKKIITEITGKEEDYTNYLETIIVNLDQTINFDEVNKDQIVLPNSSKKLNDLLQNYITEYKEHILKNVINGNELYVKDLIKYFIASHTLMQKEIAASFGAPDESKANLINEHILLCRALYNIWRRAVNNFLGLDKDNGINDYKEENTIGPMNANKNGLFAKLHLKENRNKILDIYNELNDNSILTYLKIRNDTFGKGKYNYRYVPYLQNMTGLDRLKVPQSLYLTGIDTNTNISIHNFKTIFGNDKVPNLLELINRVQKEGKPVYDQTYLYPESLYNNLIIDEKRENVDKITKYNYGNLYGPFTRIFNTDKTNTQITEECVEILDKLKKNKSVFILGYGASGSGKTASLVYFKGAKNPVDRAGVLLQVIKQLDNVTELSVTSHEIYSTTGEADENGNIKSYTIEYNDILFEKLPGNEEFTIKKDQKIQDEASRKFTERNRRKETAGSDVIEWETVDYTWNITNGEFSLDKPHPKYDEFRNGKNLTTLPDFVLTVVDNIRMVNPTTNNPQSSRSHELVFIKLPQIGEDGKKIPGKYKYLIFGDLAGVENRFTCEDVNTQVKFLGIKIPTREESRKLEESKKLDTPTFTMDNIAPFYTTNKNLKFKDLPSNDEAKVILDFLSYDPGTKGVGKDYKKRKDLLNILFKDGSWNYSDLTPELLNDFPMDKALQPRSKNDYEGFFNYYNKFNKTKEGKQRILTKNQEDMGWKILNEISNAVNSKSSVSVLEAIPSDGDNKPLLATWEFIDPVTSSNKDCRQGVNKMKTLDFAKTLNPKTTESSERKLICYDGSTSTRTLNFFSTSSDPTKQLNFFDEFKTGYDAFITNAFAKKANILSKVTMDEREAITMINKNKGSSSPIDESLKNYIINYYERLYPDYANLNSDIPKYKPLASQLIPLLEGNIAVLKESGVYDRCVERLNEGLLINDSLIGMGKRISSLIKETNALQKSLKAEDSPLADLPLVRQPCFKYYCNKEHDSCFTQYSKGSTKYNDAIIGDIQKVIGNENLMELTTGVFLVLNNTQTTNDPPKIPYINLFEIKKLREEYLTYRFYEIDTKEVKENFIKKLTKVLTGKESDTKFKIDMTTEEGRPAINSIFYLLKKFEMNLGAAANPPIEYYNKIEPDLDFFDNFLNIIDALNSINTLSVIGTVDFLDSIKNIFSTDVPCSLLSSTDLRPDDSEEPITTYINAVTGQSLLTDIGEQLANEQERKERQAEEASRVKPSTISLPTTDPTDGPASTSVPAPPESIKAMIGGYLDQLGLKEKHKLINEFRQLKKMYKNMK